MSASRALRAVGLATMFGVVCANAAVADAVPWVEHLTVTTAIAEPGGDYESRKRVAAREGSSWRVVYSASVPGEGGKPQAIESERIVHDEDRRTARQYRSRFESDVEEDYPGTTALGASTAVIEDLRATGRSRFALVGEDRLLALALAPLAGAEDPVLGMAHALLSGPPPTFRGELVLRRRAAMEVLVNGRPTVLPVLVAGGRFAAKNGQSLEAELSLLDDLDNPLALQWRFGAASLRVVHIDLPLPRPSPQAPNPLGAELARAKRVVLPGLYFDFGSAVLRPESDASLALIVDAVRGTTGALRIEGHTDSIGAGPANQALSLARAQAVQAALVAREPALARRLQVQGFGATAPRAGNDTLQGRARNRRVELVQID